MYILYYINILINIIMINSNILSRELYDDRNDHRTNSTEIGPQIVKLIFYSKS